MTEAQATEDILRKAKKLRSKQVRALIALRDGEKMNTSLRMALWSLPDEFEDFVDVDASGGSDEIRITITEAGRQAIASLSSAGNDGETE